jgi:glucose/arabinose dehydrogenase
MGLKYLFAAWSVVLTTRAQTTASSCSSSIAPQHVAPSVAPGFRVQVVANGLRDPRGIMFDREGGLLVVEQGHGVSRLSLGGEGACLSVQGEVQKVIEDESVSSDLIEIR